MDISLNSGWLSSFFDAQGGFYASLSSNKAYKNGYRLRLKAYIDQQHEYEIIDEIRALFQVKNYYSQY